MQGDVAFETDYTLADFIADTGAAIRGTAEEIRRGVTYGEQRIVAGAREGNRAPLDAGLPWYQRAWLYASDTEKIFLVLGAAGLAFVVYDHMRK